MSIASGDYLNHAFLKTGTDSIGICPTSDPRSTGNVDGPHFPQFDFVSVGFKPASSLLFSRLEVNFESSSMVVIEVQFVKQLTDFIVYFIVKQRKVNVGVADSKKAGASGSYRSKESVEEDCCHHSYLKLVKDQTVDK